MGLGHSPSVVTSNLEVAYDVGNIKSYSLSGTSLLNLTSSSYTGTLTSGPIPRLGNGGFVNFDGTDDYIVLTRPVQDDISLCCWFKTTQNAGTADQWYNGRGLIDCEVGGAVNDFGLAIGAGKVMFGTGNPDVTVVSSSTYNDNNWHFAVGTRTKASGVLILYVDGVQVGTTTSTNTGSLTSPANMRIGSRQTGTVFFQGDIALPLIYSKALTATEVLQNYSATRGRFDNFYSIPLITNGLILNLDAGNPSSYSGSGTTWTDLINQANNGTLVNGVGFSSSNGGSLTFNGSNQRVSTNFKPSGARSYFIWVKYNTINSLPNGFSLTGTQQINAYNYLGIYNGGYFYYYAGTTGNQLNSVLLSANTWYQQGFVLNSDGSRVLYLNGLAVGSETGGVGDTATSEFSIGCVNQNHWVNGSIPVVTQYNRALTASEVLQNYNALRGRFGL
jgi:hypothetical protein